MASGTDPSDTRKGDKVQQREQHEAEARADSGLPPTGSFEAMAREWVETTAFAEVQVHIQSCLHPLKGTNVRCQPTRNGAGQQAPNPRSTTAACRPDCRCPLAAIHRRSNTGLGKSTIFAKLANNEFPQLVRLSTRCTRFHAGDVQAWLAAQLA